MGMVELIFSVTNVSHEKKDLASADQKTINFQSASSELAMKGVGFKVI